MEVPRLRITRAIPSWMVGAFGAFMVVLSVVLGSVYLRYLDARLSETQAGIGELNAYAGQRLSQHIMAEARGATADLMFALAVDPVRNGARPNSLLLIHAGTNLHAAIRLMWLSTSGAEKENLEILSSTLDDLVAKLVGGEIAAYHEMTEMLADRDSRSNRASLKFVEQNAEYEVQIQGLRRRVDRVRDLQAGLNILGLVIVLLKDLPVWGRRRRRR